MNEASHEPRPPHKKAPETRSADADTPGAKEASAPSPKELDDTPKAPLNGAQGQASSKAEQLWRQLVSNIEQSEAFLAGFLRAAYPLELTPHTLRIAFDTDGLAYDETKEEVDRLSKVASELVGHPIEVSVELDGKLQSQEHRGPVLSLEDSDAQRERELDEQQRDRLRNHPVVTAVRRELGGKIVDIRLGNTSESP